MGYKPTLFWKYVMLDSVRVCPNIRISSENTGYGYPPIFREKKHKYQAKLFFDVQMSKKAHTD